MRIDSLYIPAISYFFHTNNIPFSKERNHNNEMKKFFEVESKKVPETYSPRGKVVGHDGKGRKLDVIV